MVETPVIPLTVIGMACPLPGGIDSPEGLWEGLLRGDELVTEIPAERWDADYDPEPDPPGRSVSKWGAFLDDIAGFHAEFVGISEGEATAVSSHRLLLEATWGATEDSACSSGLPAVHMACRELHGGESDLAVAGRVSESRKCNSAFGFADSRVSSRGLP